MNKNTRLVYSTDPAQNQHCPRCKSLVPECECQPEASVDLTKGTITAVLRIEKTGRGGKTVSVIDKLPKSTQFLKDLTRELKTKCGTGGTFSTSDQFGIIEIQGDKRDPIRQILEKKGIRVKG